MTDYTCILCQNGDPYSNVVCEDCEERIEHMKETHERMERYLYVRFNLLGTIPAQLSKFVENAVYPIYKQLEAIEIPEELKKLHKERNP